MLRDNTMTTKNQKMLWIAWKIWIFKNKKAQTTSYIRHNTPDEKREGGRTVGSGRVATVIE